MPRKNVRIIASIVSKYIFESKAELTHLSERDNGVMTHELTESLSEKSDLVRIKEKLSGTRVGTMARSQKMRGRDAVFNYHNRHAILLSPI